MIFYPILFSIQTNIFYQKCVFYQNESFFYQMVYFLSKMSSQYVKQRNDDPTDLLYQSVDFLSNSIFSIKINYFYQNIIFIKITNFYQTVSTYIGVRISYQKKSFWISLTSQSITWSGLSSRPLGCRLWTTPLRYPDFGPKPPFSRLTRWKSYTFQYFSTSCSPKSLTS